MRIIAGKLASRQFGSPKGHNTHPMSDKMRGALFNMLGDIEGLSVFDAFSGSGALSFEAISRGAKSVLAIDNDKSARQTIQSNIKELGLARQIKSIMANAGSWSDNNPSAEFDLVFLDPPYDNLQLTLLQKMTNHARPGGVIVLSFPGDLEPADFSGAEVVTQKKYGDSQLVFYRKIK